MSLSDFGMHMVDIYLFIVLNLVLVYVVVWEYFKFANRCFLVESLLVYLVIVLYILSGFYIDQLNMGDFYTFKFLLSVSDLVVYMGLLMVSLLFIYILGIYRSMVLSKENGYLCLISVFWFLLAFNLLVKSFDLVVMYVSMEIITISLYVWVVIYRYSSLTLEGTFRYFIFNSLASIYILYSFSWIYLVLGSLNGCFLEVMMEVCSFYVKNSYGLIMGSIWLIIGLYFKLAIPPFHQWMPDVYESMPFMSVGYITIFPKLAIFYIVYYLCGNNLGLYYENSGFIMLYISLFMIYFGLFKSFYQVDIRRFYAYSVISQYGFLLYPFFVGSYGGLILGLYFVVLYSFVVVNLWLVMSQICLLERGKYNVFNMVFLWKCIRSYKHLRVFLLVAVFSWGGLPPFMGFYIKYYWLEYMVSNEDFIILLLGIIAMLIMSLYYFRIAFMLIFTIKENGLYVVRRKMLFVSGLMLFLCCYINMFYGIIVGYLV